MNTEPYRLTVPAEQHRLALVDAPQPVALTEKYRPRSLGEMVGQGAAVYQLQTFAEAPFSTAFVFEGETGVGKTTAAHCLAAELGAIEFGGLEVIRSGMQDAEAVQRALDALRFTPMGGSGWKVVIVEEADHMSPKAAQIWLSALEDLPMQSVIVFTTNRAGKMPPRFLDRCERIRFASEAGPLMQDARELARSIWRSEGGESPAPDAVTLPGVVDADGHISFRRVVQGLAPRLRGRSRPPSAPSRAEVRHRAAVKAWQTRRARATAAAS